MKDRERRDSAPQDFRRRVSRRWIIKRLVVGVAEMATGIATPRSLEPAGLSLFSAGFNTLGFTLASRDKIPTTDPIVFGAGIGSATYIGKKSLELLNK